VASAAYEKRIRNYLAKHPGATRADARGHRATPERPERASRNPEKYSDYIGRRAALEREVQALKTEIFSRSDKWRADRSQRHVKENPVTHKVPSMAAMQRFVDEGSDLFDAEDFDWNDDEWDFLRYH
jgi:hypothetical protein